MVNCNFTNRKLGQIRVVEDAQPDPQDFSFTAGGGLTPTSFQLDDDRDNNDGLANSRRLLRRAAGHVPIAHAGRLGPRAGELLGLDSIQHRPSPTARS